MAFENQLGEIQEEYINDADQAMLPAGNGLGDILNSQKLGVNMLYTITYSSGNFFNLWRNGKIDSDANVKQDISDRFLEGTIIDVDRTAFSGRFAISFVPSVQHDLAYWKDTFQAILYDIGFPDAAYVTSEGGSESSQPGGAAQIASSATSAVKDTASSALDATKRGSIQVVQAAGSVVGAGAKEVSSLIFGPLLPVIIIAGGLAVGYFYMQSKTVGALTPSMFKKNPRGHHARRGYR